VNKYIWEKSNKEISEYNSYYRCDIIFTNEVIYNGKLYYCTQDNIINITPLDYD